MYGDFAWYKKCYWSPRGWFIHSNVLISFCVSQLAPQVSHLNRVALRSAVCGKSWWNHVFSSRQSLRGHIPSCWLDRVCVVYCVSVCVNRLLRVVPNSSLLLPIDPSNIKERWALLDDMYYSCKRKGICVLWFPAPCLCFGGVGPAVASQAPAGSRSQIKSLRPTASTYHHQPTSKTHKQIFSFSCDHDDSQLCVIN